MALPAKDKKRYTAEEYFELERQAEYKSEFVDGEIFAFAGASEPHNLVTTNLTIALGSQLVGKPCKLYPGDMRVQLAKSTRYFYPDVVIVCGEAEFVSGTRDTLVNPTFVVEILSPSTKNYGRGEEFRRYRTLNSLQTYVLVSQHEPLVEVFERQEDERWMFSELSALDSMISFPSIRCELLLEKVYDKVDFEQAEQEVEPDETDS